MSQVSKKQITELLDSSVAAVEKWIGVLAPGRAGQKLTGILSSSVEASHVDNPLDEFPKFMGLVHSHATKLGLVFKAPIDEENYHACWKELKQSMSVLVLLMSLTKQLRSQQSKYSQMLTVELCDGIKTLLVSVRSLLLDLRAELCESTDSHCAVKSGRLVSVGRVWESCQTVEKTVENGSSGLLKQRIKQSNRIVTDALKEYESWLANPGKSDDFDWDDGSDNSNEDTEESHEVDPKLVDFAQVWDKKMKMVRLLMGSLGKSIPSSRYTVKFSKAIDLLNEKRLKVGERTDDLVASVIYDEDLEEAREAAKELRTEATDVAEIVKKMNAGNSMRIKWMETWELKFSESPKPVEKDTKQEEH